MDKWRGKNAVVIGANSGIGASLTNSFLENGIFVYAWDKDTTYLEEAKEREYGEFLTILKTDITDDDQVQNSVEYLKENTESIDIFVFSVGVIEINTLIDGEASEWEDLMNLNLIAYCVCMKGVVGVMLEKNAKLGQIIVMNSKAGVSSLHLQRGHFFAAIDRGIMATVEAVRYELKERKSSIKISSINSGVVRTNIFKSELSKSMLNVIVPLMPNDIVDAVDFILGTPPNVLVNRIVLTGKGFIKAHLLPDPGSSYQERVKKFSRRRA